MADASQSAHDQGASKQPPQGKGKRRVPILGWFIGISVVMVAWSIAYPMLATSLEEASLRRDASRFASTLDSCRVQGAWRDATKFLESVILLCEQDDGELRVYRGFDDGSVMVGDIAVTESVFEGLFIVESQDRYERFGDHFIVLPSGDLQAWDIEGPISTAMQIRGVE